MPEVKCPLCGSRQFYIKDQADTFSSYEFEIQGTAAVFADSPRELTPASQVYCCRCTWQGSWQELLA